VIWIPLAFANAATMTIVNLLDSHLNSKRMPSLAAYLLPVSFIQLAVAIVLLVVFPLPKNGSLVPLLVLIGSGLVNGGVAALTLNALRHGEVSRVIPVVTTSPIFIALFSIPLLGSMIGFLGWVGVILTVTGSVLISIQFGGGQKMRLQKSFYILVLTAIMSAIAAIGFKYALRTFSFWDIQGVQGACIAIVFFTYSMRRSTIAELKTLTHRTQLMALTLGTQLLGIAGITLLFAAVQNGPVSFVYAITNVRPVLIFILTLIISRFYPAFLNERLTKKTVLTKLVAVLIVTAGVVIIRLSV
jgi:uncharacterized membrane protein